MKLGIYVFSYNKGEFLRNCLNSLRHCAPLFPKTIIDDNSSDALTLAVLKRESADFRVLEPEPSASGVSGLGGLYSNMQLAFDDAKQQGFSHVLFIQDDMQLVRQITSEDLCNIELFFEKYSSSAQIQTCFMKRLEREINEKHYTPDITCSAYVPTDDHPGYSGFSDVGVFSVERFYSLFGNVQQGERTNNAFARDTGIRLGQSANPFMMWLPFPISYRKKRRNLKIRVVEVLARCGFYPFEIMNERMVKDLCERDIASLPYAEEWLTAEKELGQETWSFSGGAINLFARGGVRRQIALWLWRL